MAYVISLHNQIEQFDILRSIVFLKSSHAHKWVECIVHYYYYYYFTGFYNTLAGFSLLILEVPRSHARTHHSR